MEQVNTHESNAHQPPAPTITRIIDGRTYLVRVFFAPEGAETMEQKLMRVMRNEMMTVVK